MAEGAVGVGIAIGSGAFNLAHQTMNGSDPVTGASVLAKMAGVPGAAPAITSGLKAVKGLSDGSVDEGSANSAMSNVESALSGVPASVKQSVMNGLNAGMTVGQAQQLQSSMKSALAGKLSLLKLPPSALTPEETALLHSLSAAQQPGFLAGLNVKKTVAAPFQIAAVRNLLPNSQEQDGYDAALANHIGAVTSTPPANLPPIARAGYLVHRGLQGSDPTHVRNVVNALPPGARHGAAISQRELGNHFAMSLGGAGVGGFAGFQVAGPLGAAVGAAVGWLVGSKL